MELRKRYHISVWTRWSDLLADSIDDFVACYGVTPFAFIASNHTHDQITYVNNLVPDAYKNVCALTEDGDLEPISDDEFFEINQYRKGDVVLDFAIDDSLQSGEYELFYADDNDGFEEETLPIPTKQKEVVIAE